MNLTVELTTSDLKRLVLEHIENNLGVTVQEHEISILVKTSQNYKSEWEKGDFIATVKKYK